MNNCSGRRYDLVAFDVDGTLVSNERGQVIWQLLNDRFGAAEKELHIVRARAFFAKHITYVEWVDLDVFDWVLAGVTKDHIVDVIRQELKLIPGAEHVLTELPKRGYTLAIISGTLNIMIETLLAAHAFEQIHTNLIWFDEQGLISGWQATPYDMEGKALALRNIAEKKQIALSRTVFVGDNINDIPAMQEAGLAVAFEPKHDSVAQVADHVIHGDLTQLLDLLG